MKKGITPTFTVGLDLADRYSEVAVVDAEGEFVAGLRLRTQRRALIEGLARWPEARVVTNGSLA